MNLPSEKNTVEIMLPLFFPGPLTYGVPQGMSVGMGDIVQVPLGTRRIEGVVWGLSDASIAPEKLKYILKKYDTPPLQEPLRRCIDWVADYTLSPPGNVLKMAISVKKAFMPLPPVKHYRLLDKGAGRLTDARRRVIEVLERCESMAMPYLTGQSQANSAVVHSMVKSGMLEEIFVQPQPEPQQMRPTKHPDLSVQQQAAADTLCEKVNAGQYSTTLLDGVTGSGKTEVYLAAVEEALKTSGTQALVMLPEIILTAQLVSRFRARFGFEPTQWHSNLSPALREKNWRSIANGEARLVVGARSALFLPYKNLKLIVVDEEHDASYKQEEGVIYQARDMAVIRAKMEAIPLVLVSATPSIETFRNVQEGKYDILRLPVRHGGASMPDIKVVDMRTVSLPSNHWISGPLKTAVADTMAQGRQSLLFLNRRGYAPLTLCRSCGHRFQCKTCSSWLVEHRNPSRLLCHHCGYNEPVVQQCPECKKEDTIATCGPGVQRVAEEVKVLFPDARVAMMTSDNMAGPDEAEQMVRDIMQGNIDIIVGTQMMAKGHHFPNLTLVGIVDADLGLAGGDLRAAERSYQLLHQVSGRAGREKDKGRAIIQSYMPENTVITALAKGQRNAFVACESASREITGMPPFARLAAVILSDADQQKAYAVARSLARSAPADDNVTVLGPVEAPLFLLRGKYRYRLLIKSKRTINLQKWLRSWLATVKLPGSLKLKVDIDPYSFT